jgi:large subunit ribosomal protein L14
MVLNIKLYKYIDMIQTQTLLKIIDNSGGKIVQCIRTLGGSIRKYAYIGDTVVTTTKKIRSKNKLKSKVKKGEIFSAIIIRTKFKQSRKDGSFLFFNQNTCVLVDKQKNPLATRIFGPIPKELRTNKLMKIASISAGFL